MLTFFENSFMPAQSIMLKLKSSLKEMLDKLVCGIPNERNLTAALNNLSSLDVGLGKEMKIRFTPTNHWGMHDFVFSQLNNGVVDPIKDWKTIVAKH